MKNLWLKKMFVVVFMMAFLTNASFAAGVPTNSGEQHVATISEKVTQFEQETITALDEAWLEEAPAMEQYYNLLDSLSDVLEIKTVLCDGEKDNTKSALTLNDYYGGAFLDNEKQLVVYVTTTEQEILNAFEKAVGDNDFTFLESSFTFEELDNAYRQINAEIEDSLLSLNSSVMKEATRDMIDYTRDIRAWTFYESKNQIVVQIDDLNQEKVKFFLNKFDQLDPEMFVFENADKLVMTETIRPGSQLWGSTSSSNGGMQSAGYRAYRIDSNGNRINGFTAAGHAYKANLYRNATRVGALYDHIFAGAYDSAFYDATSGTTLSNVTAYSDSEGGNDDVVTLSTSLSRPELEGMSVAKVGGKSFYTEGTILSKNHSWVESATGVLHNHVFLSSMRSLSGDSGGCAFFRNGNQYNILGQMSASYTTDGSDYVTDSNFLQSVIAEGCHMGMPFVNAVYLY